MTSVVEIACLGLTAIHTRRPYMGEPHFHVCGACSHIWMHDAAPAQSHDCPKCEAGPFTEGWGSYRSAHEHMVALKQAVPAPAAEGA